LDSNKAIGSVKMENPEDKRDAIDGVEVSID
jgi:hypothetical protein